MKKKLEIVKLEIETKLISFEIAQIEFFQIAQIIRNWPFFHNLPYLFCFKLVIICFKINLKLFRSWNLFLCFEILHRNSEESPVFTTKIFNLKKEKKTIIYFLHKTMKNIKILMF